MALIIAGYTIDAELSSEHTFDTEITEHPVEAGADVADHARVRPDMVTIEGVVSDTPIGAMVAIRGGDTVPSSEAFARLQAIRDAREPVTIQTRLKTYDNMMLQSLSAPQDATTGRALRFRATFKQIILITNERVTVLVSEPRAKKKTDLGNKPATPVTTVPAKPPAVNPAQAPVRRIPTAAGGSGYAPPGRVLVGYGGS